MCIKRRIGSNFLFKFAYCIAMKSNVQAIESFCEKYQDVKETGEEKKGKIFFYSRINNIEKLKGIKKKHNQGIWNYA